MDSINKEVINIIKKDKNHSEKQFKIGEKIIRVPVSNYLYLTNTINKDTFHIGC